jgi:nitrogen regulatory protein PII 2
MKEVQIILRPKMYYPTKKALDEAGFHSMSIREVVGRGKTPVRYELDGEEMTIFRLAAIRLIDMYIPEEEVDRLIEIVLIVNHTGHSGDGKIFVFPVDDGIRIRTGERGIETVI